MKWLTRRALAASVSAMIVASGSSSTASADAGLVPPHPTSPIDASYPRGASADADVLLHVEVDPRGHVARAIVVEGDEPFASAAQRAAATWTFEPARRDSSPVRAMIRVKVHFHHPDVSIDEPARPATAASGRATVGPASGPTPPPARAEEVRVIGVRKEPTATRISIVEAREIPGAFGDPVRAVSALPGVAPIGNAVPYVYVRGSPPSNTGYLIDGVRVPLLFHAGLGPSVVQPALLDAVNFYPSAVPARYGGFAGGIIALELRSPSAHFHGEATAKLFEASALAESPLADGRGSALAGVRYGYPQLVLDIVSPKEQLGYWDYQMRASWTLGDRDRVGVLAFGSHDYAAHFQDSTRTTIEDLASDFHRVDLRYDHDFGSTSHLRAAVTAGWSSQGASPFYVDDASYAARVETDARASDTLRVRAGFQAEVDQYSLSRGAAASTTSDTSVGANPPPTNLRAGGYVDAVWLASSRVEIIPGVRVDAFESSRAGASGTIPAVEPKLAARVALVPGVASWVSSIGLAHQYPQLRVGNAPATAVTVPGFPAGGAHLQESNQASTGIEVTLPADVLLTTTVFGSVTHGLTDLTSTCQGIFQGSVQVASVCQNNPVDGLAYGAELSLRRALTKRLTGWLSYTLSRSTEGAYYAANGGTKLVDVLSSYDRTHVLTAIAAYDLGAHWRVGGRLLAYSGTPYSTTSMGLPLPPYNGYRYPPFVRGDVRLEKQWLFGNSRSVALVLEVQNVTHSAEYSQLACQVTGAPQRPSAPGTPDACIVTSSGAIMIPSVGIEASF